MGVAGAATLWIPLLAGEEITCDYHFSHEDEEKKIPCSCNFELTDIKVVKLYIMSLNILLSVTC
ncbi:hypothetical protein MtrunA17_Chr8g0353211 [Medicago truncatula]|uniref:Transmembrane protein n=1 Tax=Medicago truncatula TaxID=3880 RepID=A0A396GNP5_MEDTR|nr:hypothetical protein MtrunA17_Chr8g0353211 [Medicago truncatula]